MADQLAIYDTTLACHKVVRDLGAVPVLEEWAENCLADFNLWANGAGALKVGKASLDARLSSNLDAKIFVVGLLQMLQSFVEKCLEIGIIKTLLLNKIMTTDLFTRKQGAQ